MNAAKLIANWKKRRKAMALVMVVTTVALMSMLVVAIFSVTRTEFKSSQSYVASRDAKQLADLAVVFTEVQLQNAQNTNTGSFSRTIHATQPGMARVYKATGDFVRAHKLYSSSQMVITSSNEADIFDSANQIPQDWGSAQNAARFVDLNDPVVRPGLTGGTTALYFPIIDPRAAYTGTNAANGQTMVAVDGFSYSKSTPSMSGSSVTYSEVVTPADAGTDPNKLRLPMPVEWIYILRDGTTGALDPSNRFISADGATTPTALNPIIGRVAFWTDDESCKVNVNTASEPTFFAPPYFFHQRDSKWANFPPAAGEYQRYPGHPATVALSSVLAPGLNWDVYAANAKVTNIVNTKDAIYKLIPKIAVGGSSSGTRPFVKDDFSTSNGETDVGSLIDISVSRKERLFASVDEMLFTDGATDPNYNYNSSSGRKAASMTIADSSRTLFDHDTLERSRFFLTANSRSPEFSIHGLPRIAMWPVADEGLGKKYRTSFDSIIALCATLRGKTAGPAVANSYIFRRAQPHHSTHDVTGSSSDYGSSTSLARNSNLLEYLYAQMSTLQFPQTSSLGSSNNFADKYGTDNVAQLAVQFFDYIRCTNLYDGVLARGNDGYSAFTSINGANLASVNQTTAVNQAVYNTRDSISANRLTYTEQRVTPMASGSLNSGQAALGSTYLSSNAIVFPGHGQVSPARWQRSGGQEVQGMGRMFTLSEIGFQFICTADGFVDPADPYVVNCGGVLSGGGNAPKALSTRENQQAPSSNPGNSAYDRAIYPPPVPTNGTPYLDYKRWYSNFPPLNGQEQPPAQPYGGGKYYGCDPAITAKHPRFHPGYNPANWNMTLQVNTPLLPGEKRVQAMLMLEFFCPMSGWTKMFPEWAIVLDGDFMRSIKLNSVPLFPTTQAVVVKSNGNVYETGTSGSYPLGGHVGPSIIAGGRAGPGWGTSLIGDDTNPYVTGGARGTDPSAYIANPGSSNNYHDGLNNWGLISQFITVPRNQPMYLTFDQRSLVIKIYDMHKRAGNNNEEVQSINVSVDNTYIPVPALVYSGAERKINNQAVREPLGRAEISYYYYIDSYGRDGYRRSIQAPHWWCFNRMGCLNRMTGTVNPAYKGPTGIPVSTRQLYLTGPAFNSDMSGSNDQVVTGRLDTDGRFLSGMSNGSAIFDSSGNGGNLSLIPPELLADYSNGMQGVVTDVFNNPWTGSDVIRTFVPAVGDYRLAAARRSVPAGMWMKHPMWQRFISQDPLTQPRNIHSFTSHWANTEAGCLLPGDANMLAYPNHGLNKNQQLVAGAPYGDNRVPDLPPDDGWAATANSYGDFDNGIGDARDGAYVNKPDEGNFFAGATTRYNIIKFYRSGYFYNAWQNSDDWRTGIYMTPNRMVSSPVMFGSLPTGVFSGGNVSTGAVTGVNYSEGKPWQTLLFRPHASSNANYGKGVNPGHPGDYNPRDHYLLDLFFMPVVEPYAISEPLSTAGRLNLNYQIVPFTNITRATGMYAVMKGEFMTAIPLTDTNNAKNYQTAATSAMWSSSGDRFWDESSNAKYWHRPIDVPKTLYQFEQKFQNTATGSNHAISRYRGLFKSPSQICEIHLIPDVSQGTSSGGETLGSITSINANTSGSDLQAVMEQFWQNHPGTGDNTRERPYSNIYSRVTTRSNTFRVHMRAQVITKARSSAPDTMDATKDMILGEYRGSALIERYIDPTDLSAPLPDYAAASNPLAEKPLESYYKFRTIESKRFSP